MHKDIAIIGISGKFPLANDLETYHKNLADGRDCIQKLPDERRTLLKLDESKEYWQVGYIDNIDAFDNKFFGISNREAVQMSPEQRLSLELAAQAILDAGYSLESFKGSNCAVFVSSSENEYQQIMEENSALSFIGNLKFMLPGKLAFAFDLHGPSMMIDTGCSATLVALHEACIKMAIGEVDYALVGGINLNLIIPEVGSGNILSVNSAEGRSKSFDYRADGTGAGEGGGYLLLKGLDDAVRDKDHIYGVIRGTAVNNDGGRSADVVSPSVTGQKEAIVAAWKNSGLDINCITEVEAHGTGTKVGDPIEVSSIQESLEELGYTGDKVELGAVKSNIGHLMQAAGVASILKVLAGYKYGVIYPIANFKKPNPLIEFEKTHLVPTREVKKWSAKSQRTTGINGFSISGTNAHIIISNYIEEKKNPSQEINPEYPLVKISAHTETAFAAIAEELRLFLDTPRYDLKDIAFTMNTGRDDHKFRNILRVRDIDELRNQLRVVAPREVQTCEKIICLLPPGAPGRMGIESLSYLMNLGIRPELMLTTGAAEQYKDMIEADQTIEIRAVESFETYLKYLNPEEKYIVISLDGSVSDTCAPMKGVIYYDITAPESLQNLISDCYMKGVAIDWQAYYRDHTYGRVSLPAYVFDDRRHWCAVKKTELCVSRNEMEQPENDKMVHQKDADEPVAETVKRIWKSVLELDEDLDDNDDFFELGGNSILIAILLSELEGELGCELDISDVFDYSILSEITELVEGKIAGSTEVEEADKDFVEFDTDLIPLACMQKLILNNYLDVTGTNAWNLTVAFKIEGELDVKRLENAINMLAAKHESLRTVVIEKQGEFYQKFLPEVNVELSVEEIEASDVDKAVDDELTATFQILDNVLFRTKLFRASTGEYYFTYVINHIIADGWSLVNIFDQISRFYDRGEQAEDLEIIQFRDHVQNEQRMWNDNRFEYWLGELGEKSVPVTPKYVCESDDIFGFTYMRIDSQTTEQVHNFVKKNSATNYYAFLLAYHLTIMKCTGSADNLIGSVTANRKNKYKNSIGSYVVCLPSRLRIDKNARVSDMVSVVKKIVSKNIVNQDAYVGREATYTTMDYYFTYQNFKEKDSELLELKGTKISAFNTEHLGAMFPVIISAYEDVDSVLCTVSYDKRFHTDWFIEKFVNEFKELMKKLTANPEQTIKELMD